MKTAIITSSQDSASVTIYNALLRTNQFDQTEEQVDNNSVHKNNSIENLYLYHIEALHVNANDIDEKIQADYFIFGSRHRSKETHRRSPCTLSVILEKRKQAKTIFCARHRRCYKKSCS